MKYEIIDERTHETVFSGEATDIESVWSAHFLNGEYSEHYLWVWHDIKED
jgi:hypothetical protein